MPCLLGLHVHASLGKILNPDIRMNVLTRVVLYINTECQYITRDKDKEVHIQPYFGLMVAL